MRTKQRQGVKVRRWTKAEYYRLGELGFFDGQRVELIGGRLVVLSPQNRLHAGVVERIDTVIRELFGTGYRFRAQLPLDLGQKTEPEPDFVVGVGVPLAATTAGHPTSALLVIEVSESTLKYDQGDKASLYARAGVQDYWIINLVDNQVEIYRDPVPDPTRVWGFRYASRVDLVPPAQVAPLALPGQPVAVADLLP
jgi:Uma2 family endonuclease